MLCGVHDAYNTVIPLRNAKIIASKNTIISLPIIISKFKRKNARPTYTTVRLLADCTNSVLKRHGPNYGRCWTRDGWRGGRGGEEGARRKTGEKCFFLIFSVPLLFRGPRNNDANCDRDCCKFNRRDLRTFLNVALRPGPGWTAFGRRHRIHTRRSTTCVTFLQRRESV